MANPSDAVPSPDEPKAVVEAFLAALAGGHLEAAGAVLAEDVVYTNVGLPSVRGRRRTLKVLGPLAKPWAGFEVYVHSISSDGPVVLTERTDVLTFGPLRLQFWVWGRFDVHDGRITLWRDSFDFLDIAKATVRGLVGILVPALRPRPPLGDAAAPGRH